MLDSFGFVVYARLVHFSSFIVTIGQEGRGSLADSEWDLSHCSYSTNKDSSRKNKISLMYDTVKYLNELPETEKSSCKDFVILELGNSV